ncbi:unnamed protein product [Rotaria magnacalcarata]|uniref:CCHC-type domain-containing protein n=1 Tax=Rotaria magnacalcarata TaxID=392030 RepID=A0A8S3DYB3_9BILA|nr:unnamed protein product [Rotaria magnacalcarata]
MLKRPIHTSSHASNYQQCTTPPPQPLMNSKCVYDRSSYLPPRYGSPNSLTSFASRQCYECHRFGHIAKYFPNRKNFQRGI